MTGKTSMKALVVLLVLNVAGAIFNSFVLTQDTNYQALAIIARLVHILAVIMLCIAIRRLRREHGNG
ncbi:hypothetical protein LCGC14_1757150 [marine sediment metagenome]|uniref:Uncharacterized protein n=1 Tax=marine sediment metagenome TaxID=412755 RepID=A0A0F9H260_9ZZZZ